MSLRVVTASTQVVRLEIRTRTADSNILVRAAQGIRRSEWQTALYGQSSVDCVSADDVVEPAWCAAQECSAFPDWNIPVPGEDKSMRTVVVARSITHPRVNRKVVGLMRHGARPRV